MSSRGITDIILNGEAFELHPTFSNLDKLETVLNKGAIGFLRQDLSSGAFKTGDVVSIIQVCAIPANGRKFPNWWNRDGCGKRPDWGIIFPHEASNLQSRFPFCDEALTCE